MSNEIFFQRISIIKLEILGVLKTPKIGGNNMFVWMIAAKFAAEGHTVDVTAQNGKVVANLLVRDDDWDTIELQVRPLDDRNVEIACLKVRRVNGDVDSVGIPNFFENSHLIVVGYDELIPTLRDAFNRASDPQVGADIDVYD